jgi:hypothetical protein
MLCGRIAATTDAELASHGFAGNAVPELILHAKPGPLSRAAGAASVTFAVTL